MGKRDAGVTGVASRDAIEAVLLNSDTPCFEQIQTAGTRGEACRLAIEEVDKADLLWTMPDVFAVVDKIRKEAGSTEYCLDGPIDQEWLAAVGIYVYEEASATPSGTKEHSTRILGGDDVDGEKRSSDDDKGGDEIAELVVTPNDDGTAYCYIESYKLTLGNSGVVHVAGNSVSVTAIGIRRSRREILELCRALKAWAIFYPEDFR